MKTPADIDVTIRDNAQEGFQLMPAGKLRWEDEDGYHFHPHSNLRCLSATDMENIARMVELANELVKS